LSIPYAACASSARLRESQANVRAKAKAVTLETAFSFLTSIRMEQFANQGDMEPVLPIYRRHNFTSPVQQCRAAGSEIEEKSRIRSEAYFSTRSQFP
jgi:hypothetical protein